VPEDRLKTGGIIMLRSMYAAISGLKNFQTKLDVIGNNISNVSTYGFKKGRVTFQDLLSQQVSGASAPSFNRGGVNPQQVGLGSKIASIDTITEQGNLQTTGRSLDLAISGDGYFVVQDGFNQYFTRAGNFYLDRDGSLVNADGLRLMGYGLDANGALDKTRLQKLTINEQAIHQPMTKFITLTGNLKPDDFIDLATGTAKAGNFTTDFKIFDANGKGHDATIVLDTPTSSQIDPADPSKGYYVKSLTFTITAAGDGTPHTGTITFKPDGTVESITPTSDTFNFGADGVVNIQNLDFDTLTLLSNMPENADIVGDVATLDSFSIGSSGEIYGVLSDGSVQLLGQIVLSQFNNPGGLTKAGSNLFKASANSGEPMIGTAIDAGSTIQPGALEMSNVDLSEEFTGMIEAQRGFQANARVITTSDQILQELVDLKR